MAQPKPSQINGHAALEHGAWTQARQSFEAVLLTEESPQALEGLGHAAWWLDLAGLVFDSRERAYRLYLAAHQPTDAARVAVWLAWDYFAFRGEASVANGWLQRARRLLEDQPLSPEHAWLDIREGSFCLLEHGDPVRALALSANAIQTARQVGNIDLEMLALAVHGLAQVASGDVLRGMSSLDEVNTAVIAGELTDRVAIGLAGCYLIAACERVRDFTRAIEWCRRLKASCEKWGLRPLFAVCRTQYASICMAQGTWLEAEEELHAAHLELAASRPAMTSDARVRLGELRRRQGRVVEAESLFLESPSHPGALLGRAELAFDRADYHSSIDLAERYLRHLPLENRTDRASGLELLTRSLATLTQCQRAQTALSELDSIAALAATIPLRASANFAAGHLALAHLNPDAARTFFEDAVDLYLQCGAPYEVGRARIMLAQTLAQLGRLDSAIAEAQLAATLLTNLTAELEAARATRLLESLTATQHQAAPAPPAALKPLLTPREIEVLTLVSQGLNNQSIAQRLFLSDHTIHRHLANILNKLNVSTRAAAVAQATRLNLLP